MSFREQKKIGHFSFDFCSDCRSRVPALFFWISFIPVCYLPRCFFLLPPRVTTSQNGNISIFASIQIPGECDSRDHVLCHRRQEVQGIQLGLVIVRVLLVFRINVQCRICKHLNKHDCITKKSSFESF